MFVIPGGNHALLAYRMITCGWRASRVADDEVLGNKHGLRRSASVKALLEEFAKIVVGFGLGKFRFGRGEEIVIYIAESDDVFAFDAPEVFSGAMSGADDAEVEFVVGGKFPRRRRLATGQPDTGPGQGGSFEKPAPAPVAAHNG